MNRNRRMNGWEREQMRSTKMEDSYENKRKRVIMCFIYTPVLFISENIFVSYLNIHNNTVR